MEDVEDADGEELDTERDQLGTKWEDSKGLTTMRASKTEKSGSDSIT